MTLTRKLRLALVGALSVLLLATGPAPASHDIVAAMNTSRVTSLSANSGVVTVQGDVDTDVAADEVRTEWYTSVAAMEYIDENDGTKIITKMNRTVSPKDNFNRANEDPLNTTSLLPAKCLLA